MEVGPITRAIGERPPFGPIERLSDSLADLFRKIGCDERLHKLESEQYLGAPRFR